MSNHVFSVTKTVNFLLKNHFLKFVTIKKLFSCSYERQERVDDINIGLAQPFLTPVIMQFIIPPERIVGPKVPELLFVLISLEN